MTTRPVTISPDANMIDCAKIMKEKKIGSLIVKKDSRFIGILTEQDMVRRAILHNKDPLDTKAKDIMSTDVILDIFAAIKSMGDYDVRHLPVVDDGKLLGLITMKDILKVQPDLFEILIEKFDLAEESRKPINRIGKKRWSL